MKELEEKEESKKNLARYNKLSVLSTFFSKEHISDQVYYSISDFSIFLILMSLSLHFISQWCMEIKI